MEILPENRANNYLFYVKTFKCKKEVKKENTKEIY